MLDIKKAAAHLDSLLSDIVVKEGIFIAETKRLIRYKNYAVIRNTNDDWVILLIKDKRKFHIGTVFLKISAFALCKLHEKGKNRSVEEVKQNDAIFRKNYIDSQFYRKTAQTAKDPATRDSAQWRFEIVQTAARTAKGKIDSLFYSSIV